MPAIINKSNTKPSKAAPAKAKQSAEPKPPATVIYPELEVLICDSRHEHRMANGWVDTLFVKSRPPITCDQMKAYLGWETEKEYAARRLVEDPSLKPEEVAKFPPEVYVLLTDENGDRVTCWNNDENRELRMDGVNKIAQDILTRNWAGPLTLVGETEYIYGNEDPYVVNDQEYNLGDTVSLPNGTVNGETIIISRTGKCNSIQHRGVAFILACQRWAKQRIKWSDFWPEEPVLEAIVVVGASDCQQVIQTYDNVIPRTDADNIQTSALYRTDSKGNPIPRSERILLAKMLDKATKFLWQRTGGDGKGVVLTNSEANSYRDRHSRLLECVRHLYEENKGRAMSLINLSAGQCAGAMYLMASSGSDGEEYHAEAPGHRSEEKLDWKHWDKASEFWTLFGQCQISKDDEGVVVKVNGPAEARAIYKAIAAVPDESGEETARVIEKFAILAKAWDIFKEGKGFTEKSLTLEWATNAKTGLTQLAEHPTFGGIDLGPKREAEIQDVPPPTPEEIRQQTADKLLANRAGKKDAMSVELDQIRAMPGAEGRLLLFKQANTYNSWEGEDSVALENVLKVGVKLVNNVPRADFPAKDFDANVVKLQAAGHKLAIAEQVKANGIAKWVITPIEDKPAALPAKPGAVKKVPAKK